MKSYQYFIRENVHGLIILCRLFIAILFILISINGVQSQVIFTQTSDADFNKGLPQNTIVSGNSVSLMSEATGVNNWLSTNGLPVALSGHKTATWRNYIYLAGGYNGSFESDAVYRATFQSGGNTTWTAYAALPDSLRDHAMVCSAEHLYVIGGRKNGNLSDRIYFAKINSDGTLGAWNESAVTLPQPLWGHGAVYKNGFIYIIGGSNSNIVTTALNTVYFAKIINIDGELSSFTATTILPEARNGHTTLSYNNELIVLGGYDNAGVKKNTVYHAAINLDGTCGSWTAAAALPVSISNHSSVCINGLISVIGGEDTGGLSDKIYYASIDAMPSLSWVSSPELLYEARKDGAAYAYNGQIVFAGGENISTSPIQNTRYATLNMGAEKVNKGSFISYPFYQLGEERDIVSLTYTMTFNPVYNNYELIYRTAGSDQLWGDWVEMGQDNPALVGEHKEYLQYMIRFDGTDDENVILQDMTINISGYTQLSGNLNGIDTLKYSDSPFWVTGDISFTGGTHVIEAGVEILFSPNTGLEIGQANMHFEGTILSPIVLTSYSAESGVWNGVYFNTNSDNGVSTQMEYVIIEKAGNGTRNSNLYCENTNEPLLTSCTFSEADGHGIWLNNADLSMDMVTVSGNSESGLYLQNSSPSLSGSDFLNNANAGVYLADINSDPNFFNCEISGNYFGIHYPTPNYSFPLISGISNYNNIISGIAIAGGTISSDQTWPYNPLGYAIVGNVIIGKINDHARLTIMPGNTIYFDTLVQLQVGNYLYYQQNYGGELFAVGKPDSVITFTSINGQSGGWEGVYFHYNSDNFGSVSELNNCVIENGNQYNIMCEGTLQPRIDSCTINNSAGMDIYVMDPNSVPHITASVTTVYVDGGTQSIDKTWYNFGGGDYIILKDIVVAKQNAHVRLTLQPGITVKADTSAGLQIAQYLYYNNQQGGELYAEGTNDSIITFTSRNGLAGGWDGIFFHYNSDAFGSTSSLKYCTIENGKDYNIRSDGSAEPRIDQCTVINSEGYDIYATAPNDVQHVTSTVSTVYVGAGTQTINKRWYNYGGEYIVVGDIIVAKQNDTVRLTIEPGITVKVDTTFGIQIAQYVYYNQTHAGEIHAEGNADSLITFTSRNGEVGGWDGIYFHDYSDLFGSNSILSYCVIEKGSAYNIYCENTSQPRIDHCTITNSDGYDIYALNPNSVPHVTATNSTVYVGEGTQGINKTWYNFGGDYVLIGDVIVGKQNSFVTLQIEPGNTIKADSGVVLQIGNYLYYQNHFGGEIIAEGNPDSLIIFEPLDPIINKWDGIYFHENADNYGGRSSMQYCIIDNAVTNNMYLNATNAVDFEHVTFTSSAETGLRLNNSSPYLKLCRFINNDSLGLILTGNSAPVVGDTLGLGCDIYGNGSFGIYNTTGNNILARNNFWNSNDSSEIATRVYDFYDVTSYGIVQFMPFAVQSYFDNHPPDDFNLLTMTNSTVTSDQHPDFTWEVPSDPNGDPITYQFYYTDDNTWTSNVVVSPVLTSPDYTIPETLTGGKYYWWKVVASDGYLHRASNQVWTFAVSLPPTVPSPIVPANGTGVHGNDYLVWLISSDPDAGDFVSHYKLQVDDDPEFNSPEIDTSGILLEGKSTSISVQIMDLPGYLNLENKNYYWRVSAIDGFGVESAFSNGSNYFLYLLDFGMKVFLEGPFDSGAMSTELNDNGWLPFTQPYNKPPWNYMTFESVNAIADPDVVDWILLEFRSTTGNAATATPDKMIYRKAAFVKKDGSVVDLNGSYAFEIPVSFDDNVYLVVQHRNHLSAIAALALQPESQSYFYDFSTGFDKVFGGSSGYSEVSPGIFGMSVGDANADGIIDTIDIDNYWSADAGEAGYIGTDLNLDGQTGNPDKNEGWWINLGKSSQVPE